MLWEWLIFYLSHQEPHISRDELCRILGVRQATVSEKSRQIRKMFRMFPYCREWTVPSVYKKYPLSYLVKVNGMIVPIWMLPREVQEIAFEQGIIPFSPKDLEK